MSEPIKVFESQEQLDACLKEWQERLFLTDWIIKAKVVPQCELSEGNAGENESTHGIKCAVIKIAQLGELHDECIMKCPMESTLVHELLHCYDIPIAYTDPTVEQVCHDSRQHQLLEQMSKSLIMVKYGIDFDWFKNF